MLECNLAYKALIPDLYHRNSRKKLVKSKSTFGKLFQFSSKRNEKSEEEYSSSDSEEEDAIPGTTEDK